MHTCTYTDAWMLMRRKQVRTSYPSLPDFLDVCALTPGTEKQDIMLAKIGGIEYIWGSFSEVSSNCTKQQLMSPNHVLTCPKYVLVLSHMT